MGFVTNYVINISAEMEREREREKLSLISLSLFSPILLMKWNFNYAIYTHDNNTMHADTALYAK